MQREDDDTSADALRVDRAVGARVAAARRGSLVRLTQQDLADRTEGQLSRSAVASIELGRQRIAVHQLYALAKALGVEPPALLPPLQDVEARRQEEPPDVEAWLQRLKQPTKRGARVRRRGAKSKADRSTGS